MNLGFSPQGVPLWRHHTMTLIYNAISVSEVAKMDFEDSPLIPAPALFRAARVSPTKGNPVINKLRAAGLVKTPPTPTGRTILTPLEGRYVFGELASK